MVENIVRRLLSIHLLEHVSVVIVDLVFTNNNKNKNNTQNQLTFWSYIYYMHIAEFSTNFQVNSTKV